MQVNIKNILFLLLSILSFSIFAQNSNLEVQFNKSLTAEQREELKQEIKNNSQKIRENPDNYIYYLHRGVAYSNLGLHPDAISDYNKVIKLKPSIPQAYYNRGIARARFRYTKVSCLDIKKAADMGLENAKIVYKRECKMFIPELGNIK